MTALLDIQVRRKQFGSAVVLRDVHLQLGPQEAAVLLGPSGCGKSTLLRIAARLDAAYDGQVASAFDGAAAAHAHGGDNAVAFVFQEPRLMPWLTVAQNIGFADGPGFDAARVQALLADVGLEGQGALLPKMLSGGMAQRVAIARALYTRPRVLLLDEPFSAVDAFTRMKLQDMLLQLVAGHGLSFLLVTHDIDEALYLGDQVYVMDHRPGTIRRSIGIDLAHPRDRRDLHLAGLKADVLTALQDAHVI